jgi:hypothetical protein
LILLGGLNLRNEPTSGPVRFAKAASAAIGFVSQVRHYTRIVPVRCTCGALLPEDARFCHKCGKPQYEEDIARADAPEPPNAFAAPPSTPTVPKISFGDSRALWVSLAIGCLAFFGLFLTSYIAPPLVPLVFCAAGFAAALVYSGHSVEPLSVRSGARLGWMTGLWVFLFLAIISALMSIYIADPGIREQMKALPNIARMPEMVKLLDNPHQFLMNLVGALVVAFFMVTILAGLGGMLGAKLQNRRHTS